MMNSVRRNITRIFTVGAFVCSVLALFGSIASGHINPHLFFTSDELALIVELEDWFAGTPFSSINIAPGVYLPDYIVVFILHKLTSGNPALIIYGFVLVLILSLSVGWTLLAGEVFGHGKKARSAALLICAVALLCISYYPNPLRIILHPAFHTTAFAMMPFALWFLLRALFNPVRWEIPALFLTLLFVSDRIFIAWFVVPAIVSVGLYSIFRKHPRNSGKTLLAIVAATAALLVFVKTYPGITKINLLEIPSANTYFETLYGSFHNLFIWWIPKIADLYKGFAAVWLSWITMALLLLKVGKPAAKAHFSLLFLLTATAAPFAAVIAAGHYFVIGVHEFHGLVRYIIPSVFIPLFFGWIFLFGVSGNPRAKSFVITALSLTAIFFSAPRITGLANAQTLAQYYPDIVRCFDENAGQHNLQNGLTSFWFSGYLRALSQRKPKMAIVMRYFDRNADGTRKHSFDNAHQNWEIARGEFDFYFANKKSSPPFQDPCLGMIDSRRCQNYPPAGVDWTHILDADEFSALVGEKPTASFTCGSNEVYVFKNPRLRLLPQNP